MTLGKLAKLVSSGQKLETLSQRARRVFPKEDTQVFVGSGVVLKSLCFQRNHVTYPQDYLMSELVDVHTFCRLYPR